MLSTLVADLTELLFTLKHCHVVEGFSLNVSPASLPPPNPVNVLLASLHRAIEDCHVQLRAWLSQRQELLQTDQSFFHAAQDKTPNDRIVAYGTVFRPFTAKTDANLGQTVKFIPPTFEVVNLKVETECIEAVNLSVATSPTCLEALNLSVATSPAGLNLSVATSPCFHTADVNVGTTTDLKTLLDVGTSTECWDHVNLDVATSTGYFEPVNLHTTPSVGFTHDGDIFNIGTTRDDLPPPFFDIDREEGPTQITQAESVALSALALDLSQATANFFVPQENEEAASFSTEANINNSEETVQPSTMYICHECGKSFRWRKSLRRHISKHGDGRFLCHVCGKSCSESWQLQRHEASHNGGNFICKVCGRRCVDGVKLRRHAATHSAGEFVCSICQKAFSRGDMLKRHIQITHLKTRRFSCQVCSKEFSTKSNLDAHEDSVHNGEAIKCDKCGKKCKNKATFRIHMKTHAIPAFSCQICGKQFHRKPQFQKHMRNKHATST